MRSDHRLWHTLEHLEDAVCLCDASDRIVATNRAWRALSRKVAAYTRRGRTFEEFLRAGLRRGIFPQAAGREQTYLAERLERRRTGGGAFELLRETGQWLLVRDERLPGGATVTITLDITERKRAEQRMQSAQRALQASEQRFRDFARASGEWFWETDAEGRYTWFSEEVERVTGFAREWHYGKSRTELAAAAGADFAAEPWRSHLEALARREPFRDFRFVRRALDGLRWIRSSGVPVFGENGEFRGYRGVGVDQTHQVQLERRLREADERMRSAIEALNEPVSITDEQDRIALVNRAFRELNPGIPGHSLGRSYEEHLRAGLALGYYPQAAGREEAWLVERLKARRDGGVSLEMPRQDGRWILVRDQRLPGGGIITFALDITERKRAEETALQSRQRYASLVDSVDGIVWEADARTFAFTFVSGRAERLLGYPIERWLDEPTFWKDHVHPQDRDWAVEYCARATAEMRPHEFEYRMTANDGRIVWLRDIVTVVVENGAPAKLRGLMVDITERKRAEDALRASEQRFRDFAHASSDWFWESDAQNRITWISDGLERTTGEKSAASIGRNAMEIVGQTPDMEPWKTVFEKISRREPLRDVRYLRKTPAGERWVSFSGVPAFDRDGAYAGYRGVSSDITAQVKAENALRELSGKLEQHVAERTAELESALRELEAFSYSVSHDLRAPLRAIGGFARMVVEDEGPKLSGEGRRKLAVVETNAVRMGELVDDLLTLARLSRAGLSPVALELAPLALSVADELRGLYPSARVEAGAMPPASGDATLVRQVLLNLLDNAMKFSANAASPRVEVGWSEADGAYFVRDNGAGFDMQYAGKLFRTFERLHSPSEFPGHGIGLAIAKRVIDRHGGRIWAEGTPGGGATFYFTLGAAASAMPAAGPDRQEAA